MVEQGTAMSWYSLVGISLAAWFAVSVATAFCIGWLAARAKRLPGTARRTARARVASPRALSS